MADSWDDDSFEPADIGGVAQDFGDVDSDDDDVKDSWDEPSKPAAKPAETAPVRLRPKQKKKQMLKEAEERRKKEAASKASLKPEEGSDQYSNEGLVDPIVEKMRRQKLVEEADLEVAMDTFGAGGDDSDDEEPTIEEIKPVTDKDFAAYAKKVSEVLTKFEDKKEYVPFLKDLMRKLVVSLNAEQVKEISGLLGIIHSERIKQEREAKKGKKKAPKKKAVLQMDEEDAVYDEFDEFNDFM